MKTILCCLLFCQYGFSQVAPIKLHFDTLEAVFKKSNRSKDGFAVNGTILDIPEGIAAKCDNKTIRVLGSARAHYVTAEDLKNIGAKGNVEYLQGREGAHSTYELHSIYVYEENKKKWQLVFIQQEDN